MSSHRPSKTEGSERCREKCRIRAQFNSRHAASPNWHRQWSVVGSRDDRGPQSWRPHLGPVHPRTQLQLDKILCLMSVFSMFSYDKSSLVDLTFYHLIVVFNKNKSNFSDEKSPKKSTFVTSTRYNWDLFGITIWFRYAGSGFRYFLVPVDPCPAAFSRQIQVISKIVQFMYPIETILSVYPFGNTILTSAWYWLAFQACSIESIGSITMTE